MIYPTVGRLLHYYPGENDSGLVSSVIPQPPLAAIVTFVHTERVVNLAVFTSQGGFASRCSVTLLQDDDIPLMGDSYAQWMPYQVGQAAKTEALAAELRNQPAGKMVEALGSVAESLARFNVSERRISPDFDAQPPTIVGDEGKVPANPQATIVAVDPKGDELAAGLNELRAAKTETAVAREAEQAGSDKTEKKKGKNK